MTWYPPVTGLGFRVVMQWPDQVPDLRAELGKQMIKNAGRVRIVRNAAAWMGREAKIMRDTGWG